MDPAPERMTIAEGGWGLCLKNKYVADGLWITIRLERDVPMVVFAHRTKNVEVAVRKASGVYDMSVSSFDNSVVQ